MLVVGDLAARDGGEVVRLRLRRFIVRSAAALANGRRISKVP
jgi:hypothetical protein